jgi:PST family polysaccharide transporter
VLIFLLIHKADDYILVPIINSLGLIVVGVIGLYIAITTFNIKIEMPTREDIIYHLKEGWHVFISTIAINMYTTTNTFLLGLLTNNTLVGYYSIAEKMIMAVNGLLNPISQALYPYISRSVNDDKKTSIIFIRKLTKLMAVIGAILSIGLLVFSKTIVLTLFGPEYSSSIILLQIMSIIPLAVSLSTIFGIETMLTFNYKRAFTRIVMLGGLLDITLSIILIHFFNEVGTAISFAITEIFITIAMFLFLQNKGIKIIGKLNNNNKD